jgi:geranylgeranyl pyrophosphate synthase
LRRAYAANLPVPPATERHLRRALEHVLSNPGSLIRPEIIYEICLTYSLPEAQAQDLAIAVEYFHTASLLIDDLPCMDDASERRGTPCVHLEYGDAGAILTALAFVNRAYALTWRAASSSRPETQRTTLNYLEEHLGVAGLLNGQSMDLHYGKLTHDLETAQRVALGKTVSLIRLTLVLPALLGGAPSRELHVLDRLAVNWGLSYQIIDDMKDMMQTSMQSGKTASRDWSLDRPNVALVLGIDGAIERLQRLMRLGDIILDRLIVLRPGAGFLKALRAEQGDEAMNLIREFNAVAMEGAA